MSSGGCIARVLAPTVTLETGFAKPELKGAAFSLVSGLARDPQNKPHAAKRGTSG
jgi:hypothetical protein